MKKCLICGTEEPDWKRATCRACGEATWQRFALVQDESGNLVKAEDRPDIIAAMLGLEEKPAEEKPVEQPPKRGPGRPRKSQ